MTPLVIIGTGGHAREALDIPDATIGAVVALGAGTIIAAGARVTTNVTLGRHAPCQRERVGQP